MRRIVSLAMESRVPQMPTISLEEEGILLNEASSLVEQTQSDLTEIDRVEEVAQALEDLAVVASRITEATPTEAALIELAGDAMVAGTEVAPEEMVPAMESFIGKKIAVEGFKETAEKLWASIKEFLKGVWQKLQAFFDHIVAAIGSLKARVKGLQHRVSQIDASAKIDPRAVFKPHLDPKALCLDGAVIKTGAQLTDGLKDLDKLVNHFGHDYPEKLADWGSNLAQKLTTIQPQDSAADAAKVIVGVHKDMSRLIVMPFVQHKLDAPKSFQKSEWERSTEGFLGNFKIKTFEYTGTDSGEEEMKNNILGGYAFNYINATRHEFVAQTAKPGVIASSMAGVKPLQVAEMRDVLAQCLKIVETVEGYKASSGIQKIKSSRLKIEAATDKLAKKFATSTADSKNIKGVEANRGIESLVRSCFQLNTTYAKLSNAPGTNVLNSAISTVRSILVYVRASAALYDGKPAVAGQASPAQLAGA